MIKNRVKYFILCGFLAYFCILYNRRVTFLIFLTVVLLPFLSAALVRICSRYVKIELKVEPARIKKGDRCKVAISITNQSSLPISKLSFSLQYCNSIYEVIETKTIGLSFLGKSTQEVELYLTPVYSGKLDLWIDRIELWDYTGCTRVVKKNRIQNTALVFPDAPEIDEPLRVGSYHLFENESILLPKPGNDLTEILNIRQYEPGDRISRIHWKLSSKCDELMIKEYANPLYYYPLFLVDVRKSEEEEGMEAVEGLFESFFSLALWHIDHSQPIEVAYYDIESQQNQSMIVTTREELDMVLCLLYSNSYKDTRSQSLFNYSLTNEAQKHSNIVYLTTQMEEDLELLERLEVFLLYLPAKADSWDTESFLRQWEHGIAEVNVSQLNRKGEILRAVHNYMSGNRGEEYEGE